MPQLDPHFKETLTAEIQDVYLQAQELNKGMDTPEQFYKDTIQRIQLATSHTLLLTQSKKINQEIIRLLSKTLDGTKAKLAGNFITNLIIIRIQIIKKNSDSSLKNILNTKFPENDFETFISHTEKFLQISLSGNPASAIKEIFHEIIQSNAYEYETIYNRYITFFLDHLNKETLQKHSKSIETYLPITRPPTTIGATKNTSRLTGDEIEILKQLFLNTNTNEYYQQLIKTKIQAKKILKPAEKKLTIPDEKAKIDLYALTEELFKKENELKEIFDGHLNSVIKEWTDKHPDFLLSTIRNDLIKSAYEEHIFNVFFGKMAREPNTDQTEQSDILDYYAIPKDRKQKNLLSEREQTWQITFFSESSCKKTLEHTTTKHAIR